MDRALDEVLEEAIRDGGEPPLTDRHLTTALGALRPSTASWLNRSRNHVDFGNVGGRWDDVAAYLATRSVAKHLRRAEFD